MSVCGLVEGGVSSAERSLELDYSYMTKILALRKLSVSCRLPYSNCPNNQAPEGMIGQSLMLQTSRHESRYIHNAVNLL